MKALVYTKPNEVQYQEYPYPVLNDGEVIIQAKAVGICGSDMHAYHGRDPRRNPGLVMGHEISGVITESATGRYAVGQRVTVNPLITCGYCEFCRSGNDNLCKNRTMVGMSRPGAFAEYMSIPESSIIPLPIDLPHQTAVLTEPIASALHALNISMRKMSRPVQEQKVLVIGSGAIGLSMTLLLQIYGVRHLDLAETNPLRRETAAKYTNARVFDPMNNPVNESSYHYVVDAVGCKATRDMSIYALMPQGMLMHIGLQDWATEVDMRKITLAELTVLGTYCYSYIDMLATVDILQSRVFGDLGWVETYKLSEGQEAFSILDRGKTKAAKILLIP